MVVKQSKALLKYKIPYNYNVNEYYRFNGVPPSVAEKLLTGYPNARKRDTQGRYSPTMQSMVALAKRYNGYLEGYIDVGNNKDGLNRIIFDGVYLSIPLAQVTQAKKLAQRLRPNEFDLITPAHVRHKYYPSKCAGLYRLWWD